MYHSNVPEINEKELWTVENGTANEETRVLLSASFWIQGKAKHKTHFINANTNNEKGECHIMTCESFAKQP